MIQKMEELKPSGRVTAGGVAIGLSVAVLVSLPLGVVYGFILSKSRFLGSIAFVSLGLAAVVPAIAGLYAGKIRNVRVANGLGVLSYLAIVLSGNFLAFRVLETAELPVFYHVLLVLNLITAAAVADYALSSWLLFDEENECWYRTMFFGTLSADDFGKLEMIVAENTTLEDMRGYTFKSAPREPFKTFDLKVKTSAPIGRAFVKAVKNYRVGETVKTQTLTGFIPYEWAEILHEKVEAQKVHSYT